MYSIKVKPTSHLKVRVVHFVNKSKATYMASSGYIQKKHSKNFRPIHGFKCCPFDTLDNSLLGMLKTHVRMLVQVLIIAILFQFPASAQNWRQ